MAATDRFLAAGTKILVKDTTFRIFAGIVNIPGPSMSTEDIDATELDPYQGSTTTPAAIEMVKQWLAGWTDLGEIAFEMNFTQQEWVFALAKQRARTELYFKINLRNGYSILLKGYIKGLSGDFQIGDLAKAPCTIKLNDVQFASTGSGTETGWGS